MQITNRKKERKKLSRHTKRERTRWIIQCYEHSGSSKRGWDISRKEIVRQRTKEHEQREEEEEVKSQVS